MAAGPAPKETWPSTKSPAGQWLLKVQQQAGEAVTKPDNGGEQCRGVLVEVLRIGEGCCPLPPPIDTGLLRILAMFLEVYGRQSLGRQFAVTATVMTESVDAKQKLRSSYVSTARYMLSQYLLKHLQHI